MKLHKNPVYKSLNLLEKQSKKMQKIAQRYYGNSRIFFLKEYCTVRVGTARRSGHTTSLAKFALDKMEKGKKVLIVSYNQNLSTLCRDLIVKNCQEGSMFGHVAIQKSTLTCVEGENGTILFGTRYALKKGSLRGWTFDYILVDIACMWKKKEVDLLYKELGPCLDNTKYPIIAFLE